MRYSACDIWTDYIVMGTYESIMGKTYRIFLKCYSESKYWALYIAQKDTLQNIPQHNSFVS